MGLRSLVPVVAILLAGVACRGSGAGDDALGELGARFIDRPTLERYVRHETGVESELLDESAIERLAENLVVEILFARAAQRGGIGLNDHALVAEIERAGGTSIADPALAEADARRRLLAQAYEAARLVPLVNVTAEEIEANLGPPPPRRQREHVVFRQIRAHDRESADVAHQRVARQKQGFEQVAREMSSAPDHGALQQRSLAALPKRAADVLRRLPEGSVSKPIEVDGAYFVFQLEARNRDPDPGRERERREVRKRLMRAKLEHLRRAEWMRLSSVEGVAPPGADDEEES